MIIYAWIFCLIFMGFLLLFGQMTWLKKVQELLRRTEEGMDQASHLRALENRHRLMELRQRNSIWRRMEDTLRYSGLSRRFPGCTAEKWIAGNLLMYAGVFCIVQVAGGNVTVSVAVTGSIVVMEWMVMNTLRFLEFRSVNEDLLKCLNFWEITASPQGRSPPYWDRSANTWRNRCEAQWRNVLMKPRLPETTPQHC